MIYDLRPSPLTQHVCTHSCCRLTSSIANPMTSLLEVTVSLHTYITQMVPMQLGISSTGTSQIIYDSTVVQKFPEGNGREKTETELNSDSGGKHHVLGTWKCVKSLCTACTAVRTVTGDPCSMKRDWRSMLCVLCMEIFRAFPGISITRALHLGVWN